MSEKKPYISDPTDQSAGRPATFIFLHGYADDADGLPLGLAQQFQFNKKLPYLKWVLPYAPVHPTARERAWYLPKALPNASKPRVPGEEEEDDINPDDEEGIMISVDKVDALIQEQIDAGVEPSRIIVGGFSQGCAVSLVWGLTGRLRDKVGGVVATSGYMPLSDRIDALRKEKDRANDSPEKKKWFYVHGTKDVLVPKRLFEHGQAELKKFIDDKDLEVHLYEGMGHSTCNAELRDLLGWLNGIIPP